MTWISSTTATDGTDTCPVCWGGHGCDLVRGHAHTDHLCLDSNPDHLEYQDADPCENIVFYDICSRSPVGDVANFMADWRDRETLFGPEVISEQIGTWTELEVPDEEDDHVEQGTDQQGHR